MQALYSESPHLTPRHGRDGSFTVPILQMGKPRAREVKVSGLEKEAVREGNPG